jgi:hypothetical protein
MNRVKLPHNNQNVVNTLKGIMGKFLNSRYSQESRVGGEGERERRRLRNSSKLQS